MSQPSNSAVRGSTTSSASGTPPPAATTGDFVVNLCASTTPMALAKPSAPELARYTFFVSRRREEGRERFRLHMGYFATRDDAEQMLLLVRDLYPAAWVGETPGRKLGTSTAARSSAPVSPASVTGRSTAAAPAPAVAPTPAAAPESVAPIVAAPLPAPVAQVVPPVAPPSRVAGIAPAATPVRAPSSAPAVAAAAVAQRRMPPASNVREVIAALEPEGESTSETQRARALPEPASPAPAARPSAAAPATAPAARPPLAAPAAPAPPPAVASPVPAVRSTVPGADMTDSQVLRVLEGRAAAAQAHAGDAAPGTRDIALLSPQDTQTWRDIKAQIKRDAVVHFAVQLNWSVTPIELARVPALAIFNAYTLYKIEGNREGRKWYGLRLGFFSDAVAAKQVAHYVRSEFAQVAVVPVGINEREQARQIGAIALPTPTPTPTPSARSSSGDDNEITLIDEAPAPAASPMQATTAPAPLAPQGPAATRAPASAARRPSRPRGAPQSLEETLEILGASQLSIDSGRGERVVIDGRPRTVDAPSSTFSKLLERLGEKLRK